MGADKRLAVLRGEDIGRHTAAPLQQADMAVIHAAMALETLAFRKAGGIIGDQKQERGEQV